MSDSQNMDNHILPECFLDTNLVETLVPPVNAYNHQESNGAVTREMQGIKLNNEFAVGIIDRDKQEVKYLKEFELLANKSDVDLYKHPEKNHCMIVHPPLEKWIITECESVNLNLQDYVSFTNFKEFKKIAKTRTSKYDRRFKSLFEDLKKNKAAGIIQLLEWTNYLINNPYQADINLLKGNTL